MNVPVGSEVLHIKGHHSFLLVGSVLKDFPLCIETQSEEYVQGVHAGDLVVVSAPEGGPVEPALMLLELVRTYHLPLMVLPKNHPGSKRVPYVVSAGPRIQTNCSIIRGTHPEQHLICASDELGGVTLRGTDGGVVIDGLPSGFCVSRISGPVPGDPV
ncbi:MAG TPA: alpha/beta hydrolase [Methanoregula sp.]|nr:alpha/beta hydrolase [Methanoregula sp.]